MTIKQLRNLAVYHAEQASSYATAASGLGTGGTAAEFREKADFHREAGEQLAGLADSFAALVRSWTTGEIQE